MHVGARPPLEPPVLRPRLLQRQSVLHTRGESGTPAPAAARARVCECDKVDVDRRRADRRVLEPHDELVRTGTAATAAAARADVEREQVHALRQRAHRAAPPTGLPLGTLAGESP